MASDRFDPVELMLERAHRCLAVEGILGQAAELVERAQADMDEPEGSPLRRELSIEIRRLRRLSQSLDNLASDAPASVVALRREAAGAQ